MASTLDAIILPYTRNVDTPKLDFLVTSRYFVVVIYITANPKSILSIVEAALVVLLRHLSSLIHGYFAGGAIPGSRHLRKDANPCSVLRCDRMVSSLRGVICGITPAQVPTARKFDIRVPLSDTDRGTARLILLVIWNTVRLA